VTAIADLEIFARVARTGNMSAAGREMNLSPAVVSKRISLLEEELGARLFQRTTRQLTLTETGEGYYKRVVDILNLVEEAEDFVARRNTNARGLLKVTAPTTFTRLHIAPVLSQFLARYPEIELDLNLTDDFVDIISRGFDVAIRIGELQDSSLVQKKLASDHRVMVAAPAYIERFGAPEKLADLDFHNCLSAGAQEFWKLQGPDGVHQTRVKGNIRSNSADLVRQALLDGLGIGLRSLWDVGPELRRGELKVVLPQYRGADSVAIYAVYPCREFMPTKVNALIEFLGEVFSSETSWPKSAALPDGAIPAQPVQKSTPKPVPPAAAKTASEQSTERRRNAVKAR
jgi:DNA-binding transcriptional LysR family regulator